MDPSDSPAPARRLARFLGYHALGFFQYSQMAPLVFFHAGWVLLLVASLQDSMSRQGLSLPAASQVFFRLFASFGGVDENGHGSMDELMEVYGRLSLILYLGSLLVPRRLRSSAAGGSHRRKALRSMLVAALGYSAVLYLSRSAITGPITDGIIVMVIFSVLAGVASLWASRVRSRCEALQHRLRQPEARARLGGGVSWSVERLLEVAILIASCAWAFVPPARYWLEYAQESPGSPRRRYTPAAPERPAREAEVAPESPPESPP
jgi:hypothetical protein